MACYVRMELHSYVQHVMCDPTNSFAVLKVSKEAGFEQDLYLIVCYIAPRDSTSIICYIAPRDSTSISMASRDIWVQLDDTVSAMLSKGQVLVVGGSQCANGVQSRLYSEQPCGRASSYGACSYVHGKA